MSHKITPQPEYPLNDYQLEALSRLAESLPVSGGEKLRFDGA